MGDVTSSEPTGKTRRWVRLFSKLYILLFLTANHYIDIPLLLLISVTYPCSHKNTIIILIIFPEDSHNIHHQFPWNVSGAPGASRKRTVRARCPEGRELCGSEAKCSNGSKWFQAAKASSIWSWCIALRIFQWNRNHMEPERSFLHDCKLILSQKHVGFSCSFHRVLFLEFQ